MIHSYSIPLIRLLIACAIYWSTTQSQSTINFEEILDSILIPREVGSSGNTQVRQYIITQMRSLNWMVEEDHFVDKTPNGQKPFTNIIATQDPSACKRLTVACHFDTKVFADHTFLGAIDSAVPCSMMIYWAKVLDLFLKKEKRRITLQLIFFDGEEAFGDWTVTDSLYGSRHLSQKWFASRPDNVCLRNTHVVANKLQQISLFILLDLLGSPSPRIYNYFNETSSIQMKFVEIQQRLAARRELEGVADYFKPLPMPSMDDDYCPFHRHRVPIVAIFPTPFPSVWHKPQDNKSALDFPTIRNLMKIIREFLITFLTTYQSKRTNDLFNMAPSLVPKGDRGQYNTESALRQPQTTN